MDQCCPHLGADFGSCSAYPRDEFRERHRGLNYYTITKPHRIALVPAAAPIPADDVAATSPAEPRTAATAGSTIGYPFPLLPMR